MNVKSSTYFFLQNILYKFRGAELCRFINYVSKYGKCPATVCQRVKGQYLYLNTRIEILVLFQLYMNMEIFIPWLCAEIERSWTQLVMSQLECAIWCHNPLYLWVTSTGTSMAGASLSMPHRQLSISLQYAMNTTRSSLL